MNKATQLVLVVVTLAAVGAALYFGWHQRPAETVHAQPGSQTIAGDPKNTAMNTQQKADTIFVPLTKPGAQQIIKSLQLTYPTQQNMPATTTLDQMNQAQQAFEYIANAIFKKYPDLIPKPPVDTTKKK